MSGKQMKRLRRLAESETVGMPKAETKRLYKGLKKIHSKGKR